MGSIDFQLSGDGADILSTVEDVSTDLPLGLGEETAFGIEVDLLADSNAVTPGGDIDNENFDPIVTITAEN